MIQNFKTLKRYIQADLYRYTTNISLRSFLRSWFTPGFRFTFWLRVCQFHNRNFKGLFFFISFLILRHYQQKYGLIIHYTTSIGPGLYIGHWGGVIINPQCKIGNNVNLSPGVLLGQDYNKGSKEFAYPVVGDRVFLANSAKVIGNVTIGNDAVVGINSVLLKDIDDNAVAVGAPAEIISHKGSSAYVGSYINIF